MRQESFDGWIPFRFYWHDGRPFIDWCYFGDRHLSKPSFAEDVESALNLPFNQVFRHQTPVEDLAEWQTIKPGINPTAFIFHVSRCGSTLFCQMLSTMANSIVLSEARIIDSILRSNYECDYATVERRIEWLRWTIGAMAQKRRPEQELLFVKFSSWNSMHLSLIRSAFPNVPWVFLYRDPVQVLDSQIRIRDVWLVPGLIDASLFGLDMAEIGAIPIEEYCARVLSAIYQSALKHVDETTCLLINYSELPDAVVSGFADFAGLKLSDQEKELMHERAKYDSKEPSFYYTSDASKKSAAVSCLIQQMSEKWIRGSYEELELKRLSK